MHGNESQSRHGAYPEVQRIEAAMQRAVQEALWEHKQLGHHIIVWKDGKVARLSPDEYDVEKPPAAQ
jgi:hypothetical protein